MLLSTLTIDSLKSIALVVTGRRAVPACLDSNQLDQSKPPLVGDASGCCETSRTGRGVTGLFDVLHASISVSLSVRSPQAQVSQHSRLMLKLSGLTGVLFFFLAQKCQLQAVADASRVSSTHLTHNSGRESTR